MRKHARIDGNHQAIVEALRHVGCSVQSLANLGHGCPDLLVGRHGRNYLMEIKNGKLSPSRQQLTQDEARWAQSWNGSVLVVHDTIEALRAVDL